ncbi:hypothetical protein H6P81_017949 [Aristolochia fimbriata]|uniref:DUF1990 domain-containing protein n=1 Tax=Aristolochia fimbriata TaxID=158543 RepID=A0AAV7DZL1_ARIFI|nr:hypothetical protein H6P81_017949 [Aristolochia fimbriata]
MKSKTKNKYFILFICNLFVCFQIQIIFECYQYIYECVMCEEDTRKRTITSDLFSKENGVLLLDASLIRRSRGLYRSGSFNYDSKHRGASSRPLSSLQHLSKEAFFLNHSRVLLGSGEPTFEKAKAALRKWRKYSKDLTHSHFDLNWAFVDPKTTIESGTKFCVCVKEILPWVALPLQVAYVDEKNTDKNLKANFGFGSGTLAGHLLAGEERFSIQWDKNNQVWYEILSFSKPAHFLSFVGYPFVQFRQKCFAQESTLSLLKHLESPTNSTVKSDSS